MLRGERIPPPRWTAPQAVARWAAAEGHRTAIVDGAGALSYADVSGLADRVAATLHRRTAPGDVVAVLVSRSRWSPVLALGVMRAACAYLPLDATHPDARLAAAVADSGAAVAVRDRDVRDAALGVDMLELDELLRSRPEAPRAAGETAYVVYTSGSTGAPKGAAASHASLANLVAWHSRAHGAPRPERWALAAGLAFDASVWETWAALANGQTLAVIPEAAVASTDALEEALTELEVAVAFLSTPLAVQFLHEGRRPPFLRRLLTGGDRLPGLAADASYDIVNHYGPSECTVVTTATSAVPLDGRTPTIGRPIANVDCLVVGDDGSLAPPGEEGELWIAGAGVGRYIGSAGARDEGFTAFSENGVELPRCYRTGDQVRVEHDELVFLGRRDRQVKIRGQRVELAEVEAALLAVGGIRAAAVVHRDDPRRGGVLSAYLVADAVDEPTVRAAVARRLPAALAPSLYAFLPALPLTPNGKLDADALPALEFGGSRRIDPVPPIGIEAELAEEVGRVLGCPAALDDDFFELGGNSLLAAQLLAVVSRRFGVRVPLGAFLERPTVRGLARSLAEARATS